MDTSKMIHMGAEIVLLGGIIFYFNGQTKTLKNEIKDLKVKIEEQQEVTNKHFNNLYAVIDQMKRAPPQMLPRFQPAPRQPTEQDTGLRHRKRNKPLDQTDPPKLEQPSKQTTKPQSRQTSSSSSSSSQLNDNDEDVLDKELDEELQELEEDEETPNEEKDEDDSMLKDTFHQEQDLSFVQSAIRQPASKKK